MPPGKPSIRAERDKRVFSILSFAQSLPTRFSKNAQDCTILPELQTHLVTFPISLPQIKCGEFDAIGTELWNLSTRLLRSDGEEACIDKATLSLVRVFSCLLLDAANASVNGAKNGIRVLKVVLKAAKSCATEGELDWGTKMLEKAANYVKELDGDTVRSEERSIRERLKNEYLVMRVMLSWKQQKLDVAEHMFRQIEVDKLIVDPIAAEQLSDVLYEIGREEYLRKRFNNAIQWLERAVDIFGNKQLELLGDTAPDLKLSSFNLLVKSLLEAHSPEALQKAHGIMDVLDAEFGDRMLVSLLKLEVMTAELKPEPAIYHGVLVRLYRSIHLSRPNFKTIMHHIHNLRSIDALEACKALDDFLSMRLFDNEKHEYVERATVMRIWITTSLSDTEKMLFSLKSFLDLLSKNIQTPFSAAATNAVQTLFWKVIEACVSQKNYVPAEYLCRLASHNLFANCGEGNKAKLSRKLMICALASNDLDAAREAFFAMSESAQANPQSRMLIYKVALRSQDIELASESLEVIARSASKDATLLYACVLEARQLGQKYQAIEAIQRVLEKYNYTAAPGVHLPALLRCLAKLIRSEIDDHKSMDANKVESFCRLFESAASHVGKSISTQLPSDFDRNEVEWFSRNSYNFALEHCSGLHPLHLARLATSSIKFLDALRRTVAAEEQPKIQFRKILCDYLALVGYIVLARAADSLDLSHQYYTTSIVHSSSLMSLIPQYLDSGESQEDLASDLMSKHFEAVKYEMEAVIRLKKVTDLDPLFQACWKYNTEKKWDTLADLAFVINQEIQQIGAQESHRASILEFIQQIIHHATTYDTSPALLARWLRCLFQISLNSNTQIAANCLSQALTLSKRLRNNPTPFPSLELEWLSTTTFNHAIDCYSAGNDAEARTWAEQAILLAEGLDDGGTLMRLLQGKYSRLTWQDEEGGLH